jgi:hypothetical protein
MNCIKKICIFLDGTFTKVRRCFKYSFNYDDLVSRFKKSEKIHNSRSDKSKTKITINVDDSALSDKSKTKITINVDDSALSDKSKTNITINVDDSVPSDKSIFFLKKRSKSLELVSSSAKKLQAKTPRSTGNITNNDTAEIPISTSAQTKNGKISDDTSENSTGWVLA